MKDILVLEVCSNCGSHLTLMSSIRVEDGTEWLVKRCLTCGCYPLEEVERVWSN
jgi:rRNA maturation protein Nop10